MDLLSQFSGLWKKPERAGCRARRPQHPPTALEQRQRLLAHHVRLVTRGMSNGLCAYGSQGRTWEDEGDSGDAAEGTGADRWC